MTATLKTIRYVLEATDYGLTTDQVKQILYLINEHVAEVIGEDEKEFRGLTDASLTNNQKIWRSNQRVSDHNELRVEQRKRAGL